ncbi:hypothetical protein V8F06_013668 [Rhypophila decipiens]
MGSLACERAPIAHEREEMDLFHRTLLWVNEDLSNTQLLSEQLMTVKLFAHESQCTEEEIKRRRVYTMRCHHRGINTYKLYGLARYTALQNSWETLQYHMETTKYLCTRIDKFHRGLQLCFNNLCRPFLRKLTILDLPDELLLEIFEWVEDFNPNYPFTSLRLYGRDRRDINDIRNCRLVCRRFNAVSSQLLVRIVPVALTEQSLARFEEISRHPVISKGVVDVEIALHVHGDWLEDFWDFTSFLEDRILSVLRFHDSYDDPLKSWSASVSKDDYYEMMSNAHAFADMLDRIQGDGSDSTTALEEDDDKNMARLRTIHGLFTSLLQDERMLIKSGRFFRSVAESMARIPAPRLSLNTNVHVWGRGYLIKPRVSMWEIVKEFVVEKMAMEPLDLRDVIPPSLDYDPIILSLLGALQDRDVFLRELDLRLDCDGVVDFFGSVADHGDRARISAGMKRLKVLGISYDNERGQFNHEDVVVMEQFIKACSNTPTLERLDLRVKMGSGEESEVPQLIDLAKCTDNTVSREKLAKVDLNLVLADSSYLKRWIRSLATPMKGLLISDMRLRTGTWKEVLDKLREKDSGYTILRRPSGGECADLSKREYRRIFGSSKCFNEGESEAETYIRTRGYPFSNPLDSVGSGGEKQEDEESEDEEDEE